MADLHLSGDRFHIRPAKKEDAEAMTGVYYNSEALDITAMPKTAEVPNTHAIHQWWNDAWRIGLDNPTDRTFVVEDTQNDNKIVGFSRWMVPQQDGNLERKWPEVKDDEWDMEVAGAFFGGMEENRHELMGTKPHWMLEMLGVDQECQGQGIAARLIKWGTDQADAAGLESYLDASEKGLPYYKKRHGFGAREKAVEIPKKEPYGKYDYMSIVRAPQSKK
ncbi:acyl-CoA N-acyltransferase [Neohortaea acidophila]|uniref:Acyl-CoA N-acyltransferase n=1 Tax=Neohortaea acidophila TaxID=245834 RepID=A0A6A6Q4R2_9PEZI|nr:acyl-CoA N-acyltransferase [Neohortaea acidophila]KAF2487360.1 acyl-CoA N-acyltransferase [Neohortaea acidophila]